MDEVFFILLFTNSQSLCYTCVITKRKRAITMDDFFDEEWDTAEKTGTKQTWWVYPNYKYEPYKRFLRCYTPALVEVVRKRTGYKIEPFN